MSTTITSRQVPSVLDQAKADLRKAGYTVEDHFPETMPITAHLDRGRYHVGVVLCDPDFGQRVGVTHTGNGTTTLVRAEDVQVIDGRLVALDIRHAVSSAVGFAAAIATVTRTEAQR